MGEGDAYFFAGVGEHDAGGDEDGERGVEEGGGEGGLLDADGDVFIEKGGQDGEGEEGGEGVGGVFGGDAFEEEDDHGGVDGKELGGAGCGAQVQGFLFPFPVEGVGDGEAPRGEAHEIDDEVEVPGIVRGVLGDSGAEKVVDAQEVQDEIKAMEVVHGAVPQAAEEEKEGEAGEEVDSFHFGKVSVVGQKEEGGKTGEEDADGAFGEGGEGGEEVAEEIIFPVFRVAQVEEGDGAAHEEEEGGVGDDGFREEPEFHGGAQDEGGEPADFFAVDSAGKPVGEEEGEGA